MKSAIEGLISRYNECGRADIDLLDEVINRRVLLNSWDELRGPERDGHELGRQMIMLAESVDRILQENYPVFFGPRAEEAEQCIPTIIDLTKRYYASERTLTDFISNAETAFNGAIMQYRKRLEFLTGYPDTLVENERDIIITGLHQLLVLATEMNSFWIEKSNGQGVSGKKPFDTQLYEIIGCLREYSNETESQERHGPDA
ncbi:hypothetical protein JW968_02430 [Candidatus Woesearchaeota archaeon]|nr:hypothetical protein [Candidatus Woesearchaeota archaeon]